MFSLHLLLAARQIVLKIEISQIGQSGCGVQGLLTLALIVDPARDQDVFTNYY